jgi:ADP-ribose pyrophosphatase YjhB (NUDIX family)
MRWKLGAFVTLFDDVGQVLLVRRRDYPVWNLPGGGVERDETPWEAATRKTYEETGLEIEVEQLTGVYGKPSLDEVIFTYTGRIIGGRLIATEESQESRYFPVDALPDSTLPKHVARIYDSAARHAEVIFRKQDTPSDLEMLEYE